MKYKAQFFDTDIEDWQDFDEIQPNNDKNLVYSEARYEANKCSYRLKIRVVEDK